ncbi:hypothetical protein I634_09225 [Alteromonas mediterranea U8]|nr:hypothetical protein I634_09225 [Alteromonas mediterranea U8]
MIYEASRHLSYQCNGACWLNKTGKAPITPFELKARFKPTTSQAMYKIGEGSCTEIWIKPSEV